MSALLQFMQKQVEVEISGGKYCRGKLIDLGLDLLVLHDEKQYYYIPMIHVQNVRAALKIVAEVETLAGEPPIDYQAESLSYRKILNNAKGRFVKIHVSGLTVHGYLTSIMSDYFVFHSPVYKTMFVSMHHLKWLIPYEDKHTLYTLSNQSLPVQPMNTSLSRTFEEQCKKLEGNIVVLDLGNHHQKTGLLQSVDNQIIELVNAEGETICWGLQHIKIVYVP